MARSKNRVLLVSPAARFAVAALLLLLCCATRCEARSMAAARRLQSRSTRSSSPLLNALFKLNFIRTVEPPRRVSDPAADAASLAAGDTNTPFCVNPPDAPPSSATPSSTTPPSTSSSTPLTPSFPGQAPPLPPITPVPPSFEPSPPESGAPGGDQGQGGGGGQGQGGGDQGQGGGQGQSGGGGDQGEGGGQGQGGGDQGQGGGGQGQGGGGQGQEGPPASTTPNSAPPPVGPGAPFGSTPPSPIVVVPSPPGFGPGPGSGSGGGGGSGSGGEGGGGGSGSGGEGGGGGSGSGGEGGGGGSGSGGGGGGPFQPPIIYPPPLAPPMAPGAGQTLWCVAKPTVPDPIIQEAMDYACGSGAQCDSITPTGACYRPNTVLAHASFAFNSYWQQTKGNGGTCDFGGTATIVTRDPSYEKCKFDLL